VPFTSEYAGKYGQKTNQEQTLLKLSTTQKKQTTQNTAKQKLARFSRLLWHSARKQGGLILQRSRAHMGPHRLQTNDY